MKIFNDIRTLEDIQKQKLKLEKKLRVTEKSISGKTDITRLLFNNTEGSDSFFDAEDSKMSIVKSLIPLGINYILKHIKNNTDKNLLRKLIIYSAIGSLSALLIYQFLKYRKPKTAQ